MNIKHPNDQLQQLLSDIGQILSTSPSASHTHTFALSSKPKDQAAQELSMFIDHTLLKPEASPSEILTLCEEAKTYGFACVCVQSSYVPLCVEALQGSHVVVCSVVGFPLGGMSSISKAFEAKTAVSQGAQEIDMVIHLGALKAKAYSQILEDISGVVEASFPAKVKVILETGGLTYEEKIIGALLSKLAGAHFVKTSTGFGKGGATIEDVSLLRRIVGQEMGVKASGGIRSRNDAEQMILAGASRLGTSASVAIVSEERVAKESTGTSTLASGDY